MGTRVGLTGSRFFANKPDGDYDFYAQDSPEARAKLMSEGFEQLPISGKGGPNMVAVFRLGEGRAHVDVALMRSFDRKHLENRVMTFTPFRLIAAFAPKSIRTMVWGMVQKL